MALLELHSVSKSFGSLQAVSDVSLTIEHGSIFGIAGPNGAGKTTLFNLITGIPFRCDRGTIRLDGREIQKLSPYGICRSGLTRTFQTETAFDSLTVAENVRVGALFGGRVERVDRAVDEALEFLGLNDLRNELAGSLPLHQKKRLMLASAIACRPKVLMLDEPAAGLNQVEYTALAEVVLSLRAGGMTIVLIEHVLPLLLSVSEQVAIMNSGRVIAQGTPDEVIRNDAVIVAYLGERGRRMLHAQD